MREAGNRVAIICLGSLCAVAACGTGDVALTGPGAANDAVVSADSAFGADAAGYDLDVAADLIGAPDIDGGDVAGDSGDTSIEDVAEGVGGEDVAPGDAIDAVDVADVADVADAGSSADGALLDALVDAAGDSAGDSAGDAAVDSAADSADAADAADSAADAVVDAVSDAPDAAASADSDSDSDDANATDVGAGSDAAADDLGPVDGAAVSDTDGDDVEGDAAEPDIWTGVGEGCPVGASLAAYGCLAAGACTGTVKLDCSGPMVLCDHSEVPGYQAYEKSCDGVDNDCDGKTDAGLLKPLATGFPDEGVCLFARKVCKGAAGWQEPTWAEIDGYQPVEASCDGLDNDCDGVIDLDIVGAAGIGNGKGVCAGMTQICYAGTWTDPPPTAQPGYEIVEVSCDGLDNDCDGLTDEDIVASAPDAVTEVTVKDQGVCAGALPVCAGGKWVEPDYAAWTASLPGAVGSTFETTETTCEGLDNDCDGLTDEDLDAPPADLVAGVCFGQVKVCKGLVGWKEPYYFSVKFYSPLAEVLCDGVDNDCDGATDEDAACPLWQIGGAGRGHIALSPDGKQLAWASLTGVHLIDTASGLTLGHHFDHGYEVNDLDWSGDGNWLASVGRIDVLRVRPPFGPGKAVSDQFYGTEWLAVALSGDDSQVATADVNGVVRVHVLWNGKMTHFWKEHLLPVRALAWVRAGEFAHKQVASASDSGFVLLWNTFDDKYAQLTAFKGPAVALAADPTAPRILTAGGDLELRLIDTSSGKQTASFDSLSAMPAGVAFHPDGKGVLAAQIDGVVRRWPLPEVGAPAKVVAVAQIWPAPPGMLPGDTARDVTVAPDGSAIYVGFTRSGPWHLDPVGGKWSMLGARHVGGVRSLAVRPDGAVFATGGDDSDVRLWETVTGDHALQLKAHSAAVPALDFRPGSPAGSGVGVPDLASASFDGSARFWRLIEAEGGALSALNLATFGLGGPWPEDCRFAADGSWLWLSGGHFAVAVGAEAPLLGSKLLTLTTGFGNVVESVRPSPDDSRVLLGMSGGGNVAGVHYRLLDAATLAPIADIGGLFAARHVSAWRPDGALVAVSGGPARLALLHGQTGALVAELPGHAAAVTDIDWRADGARLATASADGSVRVWQVDDNGGKSLKVLTRHCPWPCSALEVTSVRFVGPDGSVLLTAADDGSILAWQAL